MTPFEQIGVNYQFSATNSNDAKKSFEYSCECCVRTSRCLYNTCNSCAIRQTHMQIMAIFAEEKEVNNENLLLSSGK